MVIIELQLLSRSLRLSFKKDVPLYDMQVWTGMISNRTFRYLHIAQREEGPSPLAQENSQAGNKTNHQHSLRNKALDSQQCRLSPWVMWWLSTPQQFKSRQLKQMICLSLPWKSSHNYSKSLTISLGLSHLRTQVAIMRSSACGQLLLPTVREMLPKQWAAPQMIITRTKSLLVMIYNKELSFWAKLQSMLQWATKKNGARKKQTAN